MENYEIPLPDIEPDLARLVETTPIPNYEPTYEPTPIGFRTYYSCPPPPPKVVSARDRNGNDVQIEIPPPVSTVKIDYVFQMQVLVEYGGGSGSSEEDEEEVLEELLPKVEERLGESLARSMRSETVNAGDTSICGGYYVEPFRRRLVVDGDTDAAVAVAIANGREMMSQDERQSVEEDVPTRIIEISTTKQLSIDEYKSCIPYNAGCYVVRGEYDTTYVGYNEAGVESSISRAVQKEMIEGGSSSSDDREYKLSFVGVEVPFAPSALNIPSWTEVVPVVDSNGLTGIGIGIIVALCGAFLVLCYTIFTSDTAEKVKDRIKERRSGRKERIREDGSIDDDLETA